MPAKLIPIPLILLFLIVSCTSTPEIVTETVVQVVTVEFEVTRLIVEEVEVTREVFITDEVIVEVTRLVEVEPVTSPTVEPTPEPTTTATAVTANAADPPATPEADEVKPEFLLEEMVTTRDQMLSFGGTIDTILGGSPTDCVVLVNIHDEIVDVPTMDVSAEAPEVQHTYNIFQTSVSVFQSGTKELIAHCREFVDGIKTSVDIPDLQMTVARQKVNEATDILAPGIYQLGGE